MPARQSRARESDAREHGGPGVERSRLLCWFSMHYPSQLEGARGAIRATLARGTVMSEFQVSRRTLLQTAAAAGTVIVTQAAGAAAPQDETRAARMQWWREGRFGMFVGPLQPDRPRGVGSRELGNSARGVRKAGAPLSAATQRRSSRDLPRGSAPAMAALPGGDRPFLSAHAQSCAS